MAGRRTTTTGRGRRETAAARRGGDAGTGNLVAGVGCGEYIGAVAGGWWVYLFVFFFEFRRLLEIKFRPKFRRNSLIPNGKGLQIQKTKFR